MHVPYRGAAPAINDLLGGHVDMLNADLPVLLPLVKAGTVMPIALFAQSARRSFPICRRPRNSVCRAS